MDIYNCPSQIYAALYILDVKTGIYNWIGLKYTLYFIFWWNKYVLIAGKIVIRDNI